MFCRRKIVLFLLSLILTLFVFQGKTHASEDFITSYNVSYTISEDGTTHADMRVKLTNKTKNNFAETYKVTLGFEHIDNVVIRDPVGRLEPKITSVEGGTRIEVTFKKHVVGKGNSLSYTIAFDTPDVARKDGNIWEVNIPGLANAEEFDDFTTEVKVPKSFGKPAYIKPKQPTNSTIFTKEQLGKSGISIAFGKTQNYGFHLYYHLKNSNLFPITTKIALPPPTNYQDVVIDYINPKPQNVTKDQDGNWLASYRLSPLQRVTVQVRGTANISLFPQKVILSKKELDQYLSEKPYWETSSPEIKKLAQELKTPKAIYDYLVTNLSYDFSRVEENKTRLGARQTLRLKSSAVCLEFTDLFIALSRAAGIPAREVDGYANTENARQRPLSLVKDILHAWPEYYDSDKQTWVMVDPTWGNTTGGVDYFDVLDFDHVAFVVRGKDSEFPIPAGGYKYEEYENLKDVNVSFPRYHTQSNPSINVMTDDNEKHYSLLPLRKTVTITNTSSTTVPIQKITINAPELIPSLQEKAVAEIPPFGHVDLNVSFKPQPPLTNRSFDLTISIAGTTLSRSILVRPLLNSVYTIVGGILIVLFTIIIFIFTKRSRRVSISR